MSQKLDPTLLEMTERANLRDEQMVEVLVGLVAPGTPADIAELKRRGLRVRSEIGDVLTGTVSLGRVREVAAHPCVAMVQASGPLYLEQ
jgi:hypothetical protein